VGETHSCMSSEPKQPTHSLAAQLQTRPWSHLALISLHMQACAPYRLYGGCWGALVDRKLQTAVGSPNSPSVSCPCVFPPMQLDYGAWAASGGLSQRGPLSSSWSRTLCTEPRESGSAMHALAQQAVPLCWLWEAPEVSWMPYPLGNLWS
jgi:hypothetical protein